MSWSGALWWFFAGYALLTGVYLVLENRRPQATLAWMLLFLVLPGIGLVVYVLFGRDRKAFSRERQLVRQDLQQTAGPLLKGVDHWEFNLSSHATPDQHFPLPCMPATLHRFLPRSHP